jgi:hypothetical protein
MPTHLRPIPGTVKTFANGVEGGYFMNPNGKKVFRFTKSSAAATQYARDQSQRKITPDEARAAFNRYYGTTSAMHPRTGARKYASPRGQKSAKTYDMKRTKPGYVITDARYLRNPSRFDYPGVDDGTKPKKTVSRATLDRLAAGRAKLAAKRSAAASAVQVGGYWH